MKPSAKIGAAAKIALVAGAARHAMRTFDFAPSIVPPSVLISCFRCSIKSAARKRCGARLSSDNIKRSGESAYNISVAVVGFAGAASHSR